MSKPPVNAAAILQATLFASGTAMGVASLSEALGWSTEDLGAVVGDLKGRLMQSGLQLVESDEGFELTVATEVRSIVAQALKQSAPALSQSALEVLTIVAYHQPAAKSHIDEVRGVSSDASLRALLARDLIVSTGMKDGAIRYRTTGHFLKSLGLSSLDDLPIVNGKLK